MRGARWCAQTVLASLQAGQAELERAKEESARLRQSAAEDAAALAERCEALQGMLAAAAARCEELEAESHATQGALQGMHDQMVETVQRLMAQSDQLRGQNAELQEGLQAGQAALQAMQHEAQRALQVCRGPRPCASSFARFVAPNRTSQWAFASRALHGGSRLAQLCGC